MYMHDVFMTAVRSVLLLSVLCVVAAIAGDVMFIVNAAYHTAIGVPVDTGTTLFRSAEAAQYGWIAIMPLTFSYGLESIEND